MIMSNSPRLHKWDKFLKESEQKATMKIQPSESKNMIKRIRPDTSPVELNNVNSSEEIKLFNKKKVGFQIDKDDHKVQEPNQS